MSESFTENESPSGYTPRNIIYYGNAAYPTLMSSNPASPLSNHRHSNSKQDSDSFPTSTPSTSFTRQPSLQTPTKVAQQEEPTSSPFRHQTSTPTQSSISRTPRPRPPTDVVKTGKTPVKSPSIRQSLQRIQHVLEDQSLLQSPQPPSPRQSTTLPRMQSPPRSSSPRRPESKQRSPNDSRTDRTINQTPVKPLKTRVNRDSLVDDGIDSSEPHVGQEISSPVRSPRNIPEKTTICRRPDLPGKQERIDHHKSPFVKRGQTDDGLPKQSPTKRDEAVTDDSLKSTPRDVSESSLLSSKSSELLEELHSSSSTPPPLTSDGVNQPLVTPIVQKRDDIVAMSSMIMASPATKPRERERKTPARIDTFGDSFSLTSTFGTTSQQSQSIKVPRTAGPLSPKKTEQE